MARRRPLRHLHLDDWCRLELLLLVNVMSCLLEVLPIHEREDLTELLECGADGWHLAQTANVVIAGTVFTRFTLTLLARGLLH